MKPKLVGGCQCGAVRYRVDGKLGRASLCHCRMCQKAFGNAFGPLVSATGLVWTQGKPRYFQSSNRVRRGFCEKCGTPLTYEPDDGGIELAFCTLDDPAQVRPQIQVGLESQLPWAKNIAALPQRPESEREAMEAFLKTIESYQHPDLDTDPRS